MRKGQLKMFIEEIPDAEGQFVLVEFPVDGLATEVAQAVVHPAHHPFVVEAEPTIGGWSAHLRPGRAFFGYGHTTRCIFMYRIVHHLQQLNGFEVLIPTKVIRQPLSFLPGIIEVEHTGHRIHPQTVGMVFQQPEQCRADEKTPHLIAAIVKDVTVPVRMKSATQIFVFIQVRSIELFDGMCIAGKMRGHPVHDDPDACLMQFVDEVFQIVRFAIHG